jgi:hypothetical protein
VRRGAQGRTVDVAILYLDGPTDVRNLYVPMTRGRSTNEVFVVTSGEQTALDVVAQSIAADWIDRPALARRAELNSTSTDALAARAPTNEPDRRQRRERILRQWRGSPGTSEPHSGADPGNPDSTREILRKWKVAPGTESPTTPPGGNDDLRQLLDEQRRAVERSSPSLDLGL